MKRKFSIGLIIGLGFGILIAFLAFLNLRTLNSLNKSEAQIWQLNHLRLPSLNALVELRETVDRSLPLAIFWVENEVDVRHERKQELQKIINEDYPNIKSSLIDYSNQWNKKEYSDIDNIFVKIEDLFSQYEIIMTQLKDIKDYEFYRVENTELLLEGFDAFEGLADEISSGGTTPRSIVDDVIPPKKAEISTDLDRLIDLHDKHRIENQDEISSSFNQFKLVLNAGWGLLIFGILIAVFTIRTITNPVQKVKNQLTLLGKGIMPKNKVETNFKELNEMTEALDNLSKGLNRTKDFATEVGVGNFKAEFTPLSDQDLLGQSLLTMRKDLFELTSDLEQKVKDRTATIEEQKEEIEVLLKHTTDSIVYAKRIQDAILPTDSYVSKVLPNAFFYFKPKDIVSGDFYWVFKEKSKVFYGAIDCTGHGVPGAFMTIIGYNGLTKAVKMVDELTPAAVLDALNTEVRNTFSQHGLEEQTIKDGMDAAICAIDFEKKELQYAGAFNPLYYFRDGALNEIKPNKFPVGIHYGNKEEKFTNHTVKLQSGDKVYIFSDGFPDQFGGEKGKKYKYRKFKEFLQKISVQDASVQKKLLESEFQAWKGDLEQVDDILIAGLMIE